MIRFVLPLILAAAPVLAEDTQFLTTRYACDRGVTVPATYVNAPDWSLAVIHVEGAQITLVSETAASGARYGWPSDGASYVWWTKGPEATLYWKEGGEEVPLLTCTEQE
ncbi:lysozyme inhibitor [Rhodobacter sp. SGA-6-6]|uniref:MliC family protein n=1 Tax=Rhodobacter sp. SGA-6-6 TaxID=2710882 RepID=UPI0013EB7AE9|nr:MliC family protein [Rhodobacter sp. SGA-6-6]NGM47248.1 lysozyme inhibitor [Rhodobacter sp. SGA-6-6]